MAGQDFFARVALEHHPIGKDELSESKPIKYKKKYFKSSTLRCDKVVDKPYKEMLIEFNKDLEKLREKFKPFMSDFTPQTGTIRKSGELKEFQFRYEDERDRSDITRVLSGEGEWEKVSIPDDRGPVGKWTGYYRTVFTYVKPSGEKRIFIKFLGVDYISNLYLNNRYVGSHEGFFASFEFDVTDFIRYDKDNVLVVEVKNDLPTVGLDDENLNGDKLYAATGMGWDDPEVGWHHCPPGAGIYNRVVVEEREGVFLHSVFIRPDIDDSSVEVRVQVYSTANINREIKLFLSIYPRNFDDKYIVDIPIEGVEPAGPGMNYYRFRLDIPGCRLWQCDEPWLYTARVKLETDDGKATDEKDTVFGMRKFQMDERDERDERDEKAEEKGMLYLNNNPVILRGANDMGHMQQCVIKGDSDQLADDILIAKLVNMNYYRFTQRPVQEEIYHYCDMLGMMNQTDFPLFGYLRRNQFTEGLRQVGEMERHIRNHPSSIMITYINEPFPLSEHRLGHRHLYRDELEAFFEAADRVIKVENPDRVIKHVEGDYDPPTGTGLSDFHCYNLWYTNHALPVGKLYRGYLPATKKDWKTGCGEYGTEGLDNYDVMMNYYPKEWLPTGKNEKWTPDLIVKSQTNSMHGDWFEEQYNIKDWIRESQKHQAFATTLMTDALRRRSDKVVSTAIHLLIDAWPSGWMKVLVGVDRIPKPSYFAYMKSLEPVRVNLRCDRWKVYADETIKVEAWFLNDTAYDYTGCKIAATSRDEERDYQSFEISCEGKAVSPSYAGTLKVRMPGIKGRRKLYLDVRLQDSCGKVLNTERFTFEVFEKRKFKPGGVVAYLGEKAGILLNDLGVAAVDFNTGTDFDVVFISCVDGYNRQREIICEKIKKGAKAIFIRPDNGEPGWEFNERVFSYKYIFSHKDIGGVNYKDINGLFFIARDNRNDMTGEFLPDDFSYWYNADKDMIDFIAVSYIDSQEITPLLFTYEKPGFTDTKKGKKRKLSIAGEMKYGDGRVIFMSLCLEGRIGFNPVLDYFMGKLTE